MKKLMMTLAAVLCCAMTTTVFTACGSDDDNSSNPAEDKTAVAAKMDFEMYVGDDMLNVLDMTLEYYDAAGNLQNEKVTTNNVKKNIKANVPAKIGTRLKIALKDGVDPSQFTLDIAYQGDVYAVNASGKELDGGKVFTRTSKRTISNVQDWINNYANALLVEYYTVGTDGKIVAVD